MSDDAKKLVLARRARFVAAAIAGMSIACGKESAPHPCLDVAPEEDASRSAPPAPCLTVAPPQPPPPEPQPCLSIYVPQDAGPAPKRDAGKTSASCDPPYTIDANGTKRFKRECL